VLAAVSCKVWISVIALYYLQFRVLSINPYPIHTPSIVTPLKRDNIYRLEDKIKSEPLVNRVSGSIY
jgi:hypothetical protein